MSVARGVTHINQRGRPRHPRVARQAREHTAGQAVTVLRNLDHRGAKCAVPRDRAVVLPASHDLAGTGEPRGQAARVRGWNAAPAWNRRTLTYARFARLYQQSRREFTATFAASNPDLSAVNGTAGRSSSGTALLTSSSFRKARSGTTSNSSTRWAAPTERARSPGYSSHPAPALRQCRGISPCAGTAHGRTRQLGREGQGARHDPRRAHQPCHRSGGPVPALCLYSLVARYTGHGPPAATRSYACEAPGGSAAQSDIRRGTVSPG